MPWWGWALIICAAWFTIAVAFGIWLGPRIPPDRRP
jgi:hypothetical protein